MITAEKKLALEAFAEGRKLYKLMRFSQARDAFARALVACPDDGPSKVYHARCQYYVENPPSEDWDGVWVMTTK
ncbi:MAG TPA: hypothetical protein VL354_20150 [Spirochaetia bacterium]|nr:hypothetical protein [Spirochaetia bacterium]